MPPDNPIQITDTDREEQYNGPFGTKRPLEYFQLDYDIGMPPDSWFSRNKMDILHALLANGDDLRFTRYLVVNMLSEAWDKELFHTMMSGGTVDEADRICLIAWLQHWGTLLGLLSVDEIRQIQILSKKSQVDIARQPFIDTVRQILPTVVPCEAALKARSLAQAGKIVGVFHGSFDPPTWVHLCLARHYHERCDHLIIGIDSDDYIKRRKGLSHPRYPLPFRQSVWAGFPSIIDSITTTPASHYPEEDYCDRVITDFYLEHGIKVVFFNGSEPSRERRISQILAAGAVPYDLDLFTRRMFSSTELMDILARQGYGRSPEANRT